MVRTNLLMVAVVFAGLMLKPEPVSSSASKVDTLKDEAIVTISCLRTKLTSVDAPPRAEIDSYEIKVSYGKIYPKDPSNEIHLLVYGKGQRNATLYSSYLSKKSGRFSVFIGEWATFTVSPKGLGPEEIPGGLATQKLWENAGKRIAQQPMMRLTDAEVRSVQPDCIWNP